MTAADCLRLTDEELANVWNVMHPAVLAQKAGLSPKARQVLTKRVSLLRKRGWEIRRWENRTRWPSVDAATR